MVSPPSPCSPWTITWNRASPAVGWGSSGWKVLLLLGWINRKQRNRTNNKQTKKPGT